MAPTSRPFIIGIGGTSRAGSATEQALAFILGEAEARGASTRLFGGQFLMGLPHYDPSAAERTPAQRELVEAVRRADGLVIGSPGYHGGMSGVVKNALDLIEETAKDDRAYLDGRAVGLVVAAYGAQAVGTTLGAMRATVHALRGWPTPLAAALNSGESPFGEDGAVKDPALGHTLSIVAGQVVDFARWQGAAKVGWRRLRPQDPPRTLSRSIDSKSFET